jgi:hypothetical protein
LSGMPAGEICVVRHASGRNLRCQACQREKSAFELRRLRGPCPAKIYPAGMPDKEVLNLTGF